MSSSTTTASTATGKRNKVVTIEYIRPSRRSLQEYAEFFADENIQTAAALSYQPDLLAEATINSSKEQTQQQQRTFLSSSRLFLTSRLFLFSLSGLKL